jgi:hypothetical protein
VAGIVILSLGLAPLFTLAADLAVGSAPPERAGAASGISETSSELGGALGLAILGTVGTAVYRGQTAETIPAELPPSSSPDCCGAATNRTSQTSERPHRWHSRPRSPAHSLIAPRRDTASVWS